MFLKVLPDPKNPLVHYYEITITDDIGHQVSLKTHSGFKTPKEAFKAGYEVVRSIETPEKEITVDPIFANMLAEFRQSG